jgi:anti-sigma-K factor RskA
MSMIDKEPERHEIEALLPWYAAGTLSRREADLVERVLACDSELARRYDVVRQELAETIHSTRRSAHRRREPWRSCSPQLISRRQAGRAVSVSASTERHHWRRPPP